MSAKSGAPSADLLAQVARGDELALEHLYEQHVDGLYAFVFFRVGRDRTLAEDVVEDTFVQALDRLESYDSSRGSFGAWLCSMSRNVIRSHLKHHPRWQQLDESWQRIDEHLAQLHGALEGGPLSDELIEQEQTRDLVSMTMANLPERYRQVLEQKYVGEQSLEQLAGGLELSVEAVKSLLARARRAFRETFATLSRQPVNRELLSAVPLEPAAEVKP